MDKIISDEWQIARPTYDLGVGSRAAIGLVVLSVDRAFMADFREFLAPVQNLGIFSTRIPMSPVSTPESLNALRDHLSEAAALLVPGSALNVVGFACTAGTAAIGLENVRQALQTGRPGVATATPIEAGSKALSVLGARRISLLVPYHRPAANLIAKYFESTGLKLDRRSTFDLDGDQLMNTLSADALVEAGKRAMHEDSDALFISCTGLRTASVVARLEAAIGRPVVTSNQALAWDSLRAAGINDTLQGRGELFTR